MSPHRSRFESRSAALALLSLTIGGCVIPPPGGSPPVTRKLRGGVAAVPPIPADGGGVFELAWQDDFDRLDDSRWRLMNHSFGSNLAIFSPSNVRFDRGILNLDLRPAPKDHDKPFRGVEMRSVEALTYGKVEARARFAHGSAVVSSLVTIYTPWPADDWNELDFEFLGRLQGQIQTNAMVYTGPKVSGPVQSSVSPTGSEQMVDLGFDPAADFHVYSIEWTPTSVRYLVDGKVTRTWTKEIERMRLPQNVLVTIWASSSEGWAGEVDATTGHASAAFDWLRVYTWKK